MTNSSRRLPDTFQRKPTDGWSFFFSFFQRIEFIFQCGWTIIPEKQREVFLSSSESHTSTRQSQSEVHPVTMNETFDEFYTEFLKEIEIFERNKKLLQMKRKRKLDEKEEKVIFARRRKKSYSSIAVQTINNNQKVSF